MGEEEAVVKEVVDLKEKGYERRKTFLGEDGEGTVELWVQSGSTHSALVHRDFYGDVSVYYY